jgi:hypothetical protein
MARAANGHFSVRRAAPVAQLDRAPDYESGGQEFESLRARQFSIPQARIGRIRGSRRLGTKALLRALYVRAGTQDAFVGEQLESRDRGTHFASTGWAA